MEYGKRTYFPKKRIKNGNGGILKNVTNKQYSYGDLLITNRLLISKNNK